MNTRNMKTTVHDRGRLRGSPAGDQHGRYVAGRPDLARHVRSDPDHARTLVGEPHLYLGRLAFLSTGLAFAEASFSQHVYPDRSGREHGFWVQLDRDLGARALSRFLSRRAWRNRDLFRGGRGHRGLGLARSGAGAARARQGGRRDQGPARAGRKNGSQDR